MTAQTDSAAIYLKKVADWDGKSRGITQVLVAAFEAKDYPVCIKSLRELGIDPQSYINNLDKIIDSPRPDPELRKRCIRALRKTCGIYGILPTSYTIQFTLSKPGRRPFAFGGFAEVWKLFDEKHQDQVFAVKSLRVCESDPVDTINKNYCKEVVVCKRVNHPNVLSIEGVVSGMFEFCMVSRWMENGNMSDYVKQYSAVNRLELLVGVTRGLNYLHDSEVVHGDLKSLNILIDAKGRPRLADFGLCSITKNIESGNASTPRQGCTIRYCAPELLDPGNAVKDMKRRPTKESDVYSLSMVIVELATGETPFPDYTDYNVIITISRGKRPPKPNSFGVPGMTPVVWKIAKKCWSEKPKERLGAGAVLQRLENLPNTGEEQRASSPFRKMLREIFD